MKNRYLPNNDKDRNVWIKNFANKFSVNATSLGFTAADVTSVTNDSNMFDYIINRAEASRTDFKKLMEYKRIVANGALGSTIGSLPTASSATAPTAVAAGIFNRLASIVTRIKAHPNYSEAIGNDLGIIGSEQTIDINQLQPDLKVMLDVGRPHLKWTKQGADSIHLYADHNDGQGFVYIANITRREYIDVTTIPTAPVIWKYRAIYVLNDEEVGLLSNVIQITVSKLL